MTGTIVVGGGVAGLTTAVLLAERGRAVRVWAREEPGETTSALSGGFCWPYRVEPRERALDWAVRSLSVFARLAERPAVTGVRLVEGEVEASTRVPGVWSALVGAPPRTALVDTGRYLGHLRERLEKAGGRLERREATDLAEAAAEAGTVVNCAGLGARELVPDPAVRPVRGQLVVVENPGLDRWYLSAPPGAARTVYILPQPYGVLLGGTADEGAEDTVPDPAVAAAVVERCARVHPALADAAVLEHRVGLRPYRPRVRLEAERLPGGARCVHNYGHGGGGITVSWACAEEAARLAAPPA
jgi:glycine/D-amino acid oxidase-like deaminating enzyme